MGHYARLAVGIVFAFGLAITCDAQQTYTIEEIPTINGYPQFFAPTAINDSREVVGSTGGAQVDIKPLYWSFATGTLALPIISGGSGEGTAEAITASGTFAGWEDVDNLTCNSQNDCEHSSTIATKGVYGDTLSANAVTPLGNCPCNDLYFYGAIDAPGRFITCGEVYVADTSVSFNHAVVYQSGTLTDLHPLIDDGTTPGNSSVASAMSNATDLPKIGVVGSIRSVDSPFDSDRSGFYYTPSAGGRVIYLHDDVGVNVWAEAVTDLTSSQLTVFVACFSSADSPLVFQLDPTETNAILNKWELPIDNADFAIPNDIAFVTTQTGAPLPVVVGSLEFGSFSTAVLWDSGPNWRIVSLFDQVQNPGDWSELLSGSAVNEEGVIVGVGMKNQQPTGFILRPEE